jgi:hypothetical protein
MLVGHGLRVLDHKLTQLTQLTKLNKLMLVGHGLLAT